MAQQEIHVFDPPLCCSTGVCGPSVDPALIRFAADLEWLAEQGVEVERFNLAQQPGAFAETAIVKEMLDAHGESALPIILVGGRTAMSGGYPTREQMAGWFGLETAPRRAAGGCCGPKSGCC